IRAAGRRAEMLPLDANQTGSFAGFANTLSDVLRGSFGRPDFDFLINNAPIADTTEEQFDQLVQIQLKAPFFLTQKLLPLIADGGRILNVSSGLARFSVPGYAAYAAMKGGVEVLTRYLAKELGGRGIAVNVIAPGAIATDFGGGAVRDNKDLNAYIASQTALGRVGQPDDIGGVIASLLSDDCSWINAQRVEASGGIFI